MPFVVWYFLFKQQITSCQQGEYFVLQAGGWIDFLKSGFRVFAGTTRRWIVVLDLL